MSYSVKLKNQSGTEVAYTAIEQVTIPLASGTGYATFTARYGVTFSHERGEGKLAYSGGEYASNGVDYMCRIYLPEGTAASVQGGIGEGEGTVLIGGVEPSPDAYEYTQIASTEAVLKIKGEYITGDIVLTFGIVS